MMRKISLRQIKYCLLILAVICTSVIWSMSIYDISCDAADNSSKKILFLSSYSYDWKSVPKEIDGVESVLGDEYKIDYMFMDAKHVNESLAGRNLRIRLNNYKIKETGKLDYDMVIIGDDPAMDFATKYQKEYFEDIPIVFLGINSVTKAQALAEDPNITGVVEQFPVSDTIELARQLYPDATKVVGISNSSSTGRGSREQYYDCESQFPELTFSDIDTSKLSLEEIKKQVSSMGEDTILICLIFDRDGSGNSFLMEKGVEILASDASIPVFRIDELGIENGALGGCVISYRDMGREAAKMAKCILNGKSPSDIYMKVTPSFYKLNWKVMQKFGIDKNDIQRDNVSYVNYTKTFAEANIRWILGISGVFMVSILIVVFLVHDIRHKKRVNEKLSEYTDTLRAAIMCSGMMYFDYYPDRHCAVTYTEEDKFNTGSEVNNYPESWFAMKIIHPDDVEKARKFFEDIDNGASQSLAEVRNILDGAYHWYRYTMQSIYDSDGRRIKVICAAVDITLQKEAEQRYTDNLKKQIEVNHDTIATCHINVTKDIVENVMDLSGKLHDYIHVNDITTIIHEISEKLMVEEDGANFREVFKRNKLLEEFNAGRMRVVTQYRYNTEGEQLQWAEAIIELINNPKNDDIEGSLYITDVSKKKINEMLLTASAEGDYDYLSFIFGKTQKYISYDGDIHKDIQFMDGFGECLYEDIINNNVQDRDRARKALEWDYVLSKLQSKGEYTVFITLITPDGENQRKKVNFKFIDQEELLIIGNVRDVTDIYMLEEQQKAELSNALKEAEMANSAKTDFLSRMSHDIRTPMNGIIGMTNIARDTNDKAQIVHCLDRISTSADFLLGLINDVLDMSKIENGNISLHPELYPYSEFESYLKAVILPLCKERNIEFCISGDVTNSVLIVDKLRFNQIIFNLISNAVKYSNPGGKVELIMYEKRIDGDKIKNTFIVKDNGIGMSEEFQKHLFETFTQEERVVDAGGMKGTGLGLAIVKQLVDMMGGDISVESKIDEGSIFTVCLELNYKIEGQAAKQEMRVMKPDDLNLSGRNILLCEDNEINLEIAKCILERTGANIVSAMNGKEAVDQYNASDNEYYMMILMDIRMPVMDGLEATRAIRSLARTDADSVPIVAMTANAFDEDRQECIDAGMTDYLPKPVDIKLLCEVLQKYM